jgi:hypothetical protein
VAVSVTAGLTWALVWRWTGKQASAWRTALVMGYVMGHWTLDARDLGAALSARDDPSGATYQSYDPRPLQFRAAIAKSVRPRAAHDWLPLFGLLAMLPDALACVGRGGPAVGWLLRVLLSLLLPWRLLHGSTYLPLSPPGLDLGGWSTGQTAAHIGLLAGALLLSWQWYRSTQPRTGAVVRSALAALVAAGSAVTVALSGSIVCAQLLGVLTAALAGAGLAAAGLAATRCSSERGPEAAAGPIAVLLGCLLGIAYFYAQLPLLSALLLLAAMGLALGRLPLCGPPGAQLTARSLLCLVVLASAAGWAAT